MSEETIRNDIRIGSSSNGVFDWNYLNFMEARLAIISNQKTPPIIDFIKNELLQRNSQIIHISNESNEEWVEDHWSILDFESLPSQDIDSLFAKNRNMWVQLYIDFICWANGRERSEFIKSVSFEAHKEGPLCAYTKALDKIQNADDKEILESAFLKLTNVKWKRSDEGFHFIIDTSDNINYVESLILGLWSAWIFTVCIEEPLHITHIVDLNLDEIFELPLSLENKEREFIQNAMYLLSQLTYDYVCSVVSISPTLFPAVEMQCEHIITDYTEIIDFDLYSHVGLLKENEFIWKYREDYRKLNFILEPSSTK